MSILPHENEIFITCKLNGRACVCSCISCPALRVSNFCERGVEVSSNRHRANNDTISIFRDPVVELYFLYVFLCDALVP